MEKYAEVLHYFGLDFEMLEFFKYFAHKSYSKEQLYTLPVFFEPGLVEKIVVCAHTTRLPNK